LCRSIEDSFGGTAKTSLIVTIGPRRAHHSETAAALAFGQRALKVENTLRVKEDVDFKLSSRKLQAEVGLYKLN
jgi:kinesin family protein 5